MPATQVDRPRPPRRVLLRLCGRGLDHRAHVHRDPPPGPAAPSWARWRSPFGAGQKGRLVHAAQAQPHTLRAAVRAGPVAARLSRGRPGGRGVHVGTGATSRTARSSGSPLPDASLLALLHVAQGHGPGRRPGGAPGAGPAEPDRGGLLPIACSQSVLLALVSAGLTPRRRPTGSSSATAAWPGRSRRPHAPSSKADAGGEALERRPARMRRSTSPARCATWNASPATLKAGKADPPQTIRAPPDPLWAKVHRLYDAGEERLLAAGLGPGVKAAFERRSWPSPSQTRAAC